MKVFIVVLILLLVLFAVGAGMGFSKGNHKSSSNSDAEAKNYEPSGFESALDSLFDPLRPSVDLKEKEIRAGQTVKIPVSKSPGRTLKLRAQAGCKIVVFYRAAAPPKDKFNPMKIEFPREGKGDRMLNSVPLFKESGTISELTCSSHQSCPGLKIVRD